MQDGDFSAGGGEMGSGIRNHCSVHGVPRTRPVLGEGRLVGALTPRPASGSPRWGKGRKANYKYDSLPRFYAFLVSLLRKAISRSKPVVLL